MSSQQVCVITNVDSQVGFALAYRFLEESKNNKNRGGNDNQCTFRLLCREKEGLDPLTQLGGEIRQVDYNREDQIREIFKNVSVVILVPEHNQQRVQQGENVIKAAKGENVDHLCMISIVGVDKVNQQSGGQQYIHLKQYHQLEQKVQQTMGSKEKSSIIRLSIPTQFFYLTAPTLEDRNVLQLPIKKDRKWSTVDLNDAVDAIVKLSNENQPGSAQGLTSALGNLIFGGHQNKEVYRFTPRHLTTMEELTREISQGLQRDKDIKYEETNSQQVKQILQELRDDHRFKQRPGQHMPNDPIVSGGRRDKPFTFPLGRYLNDAYIETLIEVWDLVNQGEFDNTTDDLKQILGHEPQDIKSFFKVNRQQFQDLR